MLPFFTLSVAVNGPAKTSGKANVPSLPAVSVRLYGNAPVPLNRTLPATGAPEESSARPERIPVPLRLNVTLTFPLEGTVTLPLPSSISPRTLAVSIANPEGTRWNRKFPLTSVGVLNVPPPVPPTVMVTFEIGAGVFPSERYNTPVTDPEFSNATGRLSVL